jgi:hypothetical protein
MSDPLSNKQRYLDMQKSLIESRRINDLMEDQLMDEMYEFWFKLTKEEQNEINKEYPSMDRE